MFYLIDIITDKKSIEILAEFKKRYCYNLEVYLKSFKYILYTHINEKSDLSKIFFFGCTNTC